MTTLQGEDMERDIELAKKDLLEMKPSYFVTKWIMGTLPYVFDGDEISFLRWREFIANKLNVDPTDIIVTGSACLGFSLNPAKHMKNFDEKSDIDVCIVSGYYFDTAWRELLSARISDPTFASMRKALEDHKSRLIYYGTIATDWILPVLSFGRQWNEIITASRKYADLKDHEIHFRIYKDRRSVSDYQIISVKQCQNEMIGGIDNG